ncbi:6-hydroxy-D-nicotine oxidase [Diplonema papillatum]|nr:6-hydroxy-D-nicotine oxidase [Diplonema papillatum]
MKTLHLLAVVLASFVAETEAWFRFHLDQDSPLWASSLCLLDLSLDGDVLMPDKKCCMGFPIGLDSTCRFGRRRRSHGHSESSDLTYVAAQSVVTGDCVWKKPSVIIAAKSASDVAKAVKLFSYFDIQFTTRCGGHSESCASTCDNCAVISTLYMKDIEIVSPRRSGNTYMVAQAGITIKDTVRAYMGKEFMVPHGTVGSIGMAGHILGGGMGAMTRMYGFTSDHLVGVEMVLADGRTVRVFSDEDEQALSNYELDSCKPEPKDKMLLWAMKGSGHVGLGVVTKMWLKMVPKPKYIVSGEVKHAINSVDDARLMFTASCQYFGEAYNDTVATSRLQVWSRVLPLTDIYSGLPPTVQFTVTYVPENDGDASAALAEAMVEINKFFAPATSAPLLNTLKAVEYDSTYASTQNPSSLGSEGTCSSKVIMRKSDVCSNATWLDDIAQRTFDMVQPQNWQAVQEIPYFAIEKWGGAAHYNDPHNNKGSMSTRSAWTVIEYCRWRLNASDPWTNIQEDVIEFNEKHLKPVSHVYYKNYADYMVTSARDLYPEPYIFHQIRNLKKIYDPENVFSKDGGEPLVY